MIDPEPNAPAAFCFGVSLLLAAIWWRLNLNDYERERDKDDADD
jgi:hypothetical protein